MNIMNIKKRSRLGFTLVELIVVIAILAILAGVAIPVYSGYIKKANKAADLTLLRVTSQAFASACLENRINTRMLDSSGVQLTVSNKHITGVTYSGDLSAAMISAAGDHGSYALLGARTVTLASASSLSESFDRYFGSNKNTELKYFTSERDFAFDPLTGSFVPTDGTEIAVQLSNGTTMTVARDVQTNTTTYTVTNSEGNPVEYQVNNDDLDNVTHSTFGENMEMGDLMDTVGTVVNAAAGVVNNQSTLTSLVGDTLLKEWGLANDDGTLKDGVTNDQLANAIVLAVANSTNDTVKNNIMTLASGGTVDMVLTPGEEGFPETMATLAGMFGMLTGYANSEYGENMINIDTDDDGNPDTEISIHDYFQQATAALASASGGGQAVGMLLGMMNSIQSNPESLSAYMNDGQALKDLDGYISAMAVVAGNSDALVNGASVLDTGFADSDLIAILNGIFG